MELDREDQKKIIKEAIQEWLDSKFLVFGKWTVRGLAAAFLTGVIYVIGTANGWKIF